VSENWACPKCGVSPEKSGKYLMFAPEFAYENSGFHINYFHDLLSLEENNYWFRSRNRLIVWALQNYFSNTTKLLEIGCGTGFVLQAIGEGSPQIELSGSEVLLAGLPFSEERLPGTAFFQIDACNIPFFEEFDVIGAFDVLEHIEDDQLALENMHQACKPGGGIILTVPQHQFLWSALDDYAYHKRRYDREGMLEKIERSGFILRRATSFVSLLLPLMIISRLGKRKHFDASNPSEFNISSAVNNLLEAVLSIERFLIQRRFSFPAGGSLMIIAQKEAK
jgi:SAM-dependent methyltransferase